MGIFDIFKSKEDKKDNTSDSNIDDHHIFNSNELVSAEGVWHEFRVTFDANSNQWTTNKSVYGEYNPVILNTDIFLTREQVKAFIEGLLTVRGDSAPEEPSWDDWIAFLKKTKLFDGWNFDEFDDFLWPQGFFWNKNSEFISLELDIKSSEDVEKCIDEFIELAKEGKEWGPPCDDDPDKFKDVPVLSSDLEILHYDDPNERNWEDLIGEIEDHSSGNDEVFISDMQFSRENIETIIKAAVDTYNELHSTFDFEFNSEKAFYNWIKKLRVMPEFNEFWFPEKDQIIGKYYSSTSDSDTHSLGVKILYNQKEVDCVWSNLWADNMESPYSIFYVNNGWCWNWDSAGPLEIDKAIDEFLSGEDEGWRGLDAALNILRFKPSDAPLKKGSIKI